MTDLQRQILVDQYNAPERSISAKQLANLANIQGGHTIINAQYGRLGHLFCNAMGYAPDIRKNGTRRWWTVWALGHSSPAGFIWEMLPEVAQALEQLGWVNTSAAIRSSNEGTSAIQPGEEAEFHWRVRSALCDKQETRLKRLENAPVIPHRAKVMSVSFDRNPDVVAEILIRAKGYCEDCKNPAPFNRRSDNSPYLEVHHIKRLSDGGEDTVANAVALCPNCHRRAHYA